MDTTETLSKDLTRKIHSRYSNDYGNTIESHRGSNAYSLASDRGKSPFLYSMKHSIISE